MNRVYSQSSNFFLKTNPKIRISFFTIIGYIAGMILYGYDTNNYVWVIKELPLWAKIGFSILLVSLIEEVIWVVIYLVRRVKKVGDLEISEKGVHVRNRIFTRNFYWEEIATIKIDVENTNFAIIQLASTAKQGFIGESISKIENFFSKGVRVFDFRRYKEPEKLKTMLMQSDELYADNETRLI